MKNILSLTIFALLFLGLGALALTAAPGGTDLLASTAPNFNVSAAEQEISAVAGPARNHIALPLDASSSITPFNAQGLLDYIGPSGLLVENWNAQNGNLDYWDGAGFGEIAGVYTEEPNDYPLMVGHPYLVTVQGADPVFTIVGDVPAPGDITFNLYGGTPCTRNEIMIPLDQTGTGLNNALDLANDIGNVDLVEQWNATNQVLDYWDVAGGFGDVGGVYTEDVNDFQVKVGYPYFVCLAGTGTITWP